MCWAPSHWESQHLPLACKTKRWVLHSLTLPCAFPTWDDTFWAWVPPFSGPSCPRSCSTLMILLSQPQPCLPLQFPVHRAGEALERRSSHTGGLKLQGGYQSVSAGGNRLAAPRVHPELLHSAEDPCAGWCGGTWMKTEASNTLRPLLLLFGENSSFPVILLLA